MSFAIHSPYRSRPWSLAASFAIHCLIGLAFVATPAHDPGGRSLRGGSGERVLVIDLIPLPAGDGTGEPAATGQVQATDLPARGVAKGLSAGDAARGRAAPTPQPAQGQAESGESSARTAADSAIGAPDFSSAESQQFRTLLLRHIERFRRYPDDARAAFVEGVARVQFVMDHEGRVVDVWIELSSGSASLDDEAVAAIRRAQPLPRPPASWPASFGLALPIEYRLK